MKPWYNKGLRFKCTGCAQCCTGFPGHVWVNEEELLALANSLQISTEEFKKKYTRRVGIRLSLKEDPHNYDCVFLKGKRCAVYGARPKQCRTFPWWKENLETEEEWKDVASRCEGIDHADAPLISLEEIQKELS